MLFSIPRTFNNYSQNFKQNPINPFLVNLNKFYKACTNSMIKFKCLNPIKIFDLILNHFKFIK